MREREQARASAVSELVAVLVLFGYTLRPTRTDAKRVSVAARARDFFKRETTRNTIFGARAEKRFCRDCSPGPTYLKRR